MVVILNPANVRRCLQESGVGVSGSPLVGFGYYDGKSDKYQVIAEVSVPGGKSGIVKSISFAADAGSEDRAEFKLVVDDEVWFEGVKSIGGVTLSLDVTVSSDVVVYVRSDGVNDVKANGLITGRVM